MQDTNTQYGTISTNYSYPDTHNRVFCRCPFPDKPANMFLPMGSANVMTGAFHVSIRKNVIYIGNDTFQCLDCGTQYKHIN